MPLDVWGTVSGAEPTQAGYQSITLDLDGGRTVRILGVPERHLAPRSLLGCRLYAFALKSAEPGWQGRPSTFRVGLARRPADAAHSARIWLDDGEQGVA